MSECDSGRTALILMSQDHFMEDKCKQKRVDRPGKLRPNVLPAIFSQKATKPPRKSPRRDHWAREN